MSGHDADTDLAGRGWVGLTAAADVISWRAAVVTLTVLVAYGVMQLLIEWQRRLTFLALAARAPGGTVVIQRDTLGGRSMKVSLGSPPSRWWNVRS